MRVLWLQDWLRPHGGAELSSATCVRLGERLGFDIVGVSRDSFDARLLLEADVLVINNFHSFSQEQMRAVSWACLECGMPYIVYSHDLRDLGRPEFAGPLMHRAALNVFISPAHRRHYETGLGVTGIALPLAIDVDLYRPVSGAARRKNSVLIADPRKQGADCGSWMRENPGLQYTALGHLRLSPQEMHITERPAVAPWDMPSVYTEHEYLLHRPARQTAGERVLFEAALCGCRVVANDLCGHMSWGWDLSDVDRLRDRLEQAPYDFWCELERVGRRMS